jgi:hypothetical protein
MKLATMNKFALSVLLSAGALLVPVHADDDETPLGEEMDGISSALKGLRRAEGWDAKVALAREAQGYCLNSLEYLPKTFEKIADEKEKAKATADYKRLVGLAYAALCQLESAFLAEDEAAVDTAMDAIKGLKKEGHDKYEDDE